ncbi:membrane protein [Actibacterium mucosum KCTC 23349]|uniref:Membrane protein n=1 Tax=Actibacterium mucosum KCTC 23349 TaxID=1454373 RepID=A0A037ZFU3_9RHOB|nr:DUF2189 domain-containing protein [Actibacterium mucosum]KAJ54468.1 membrane protein [Actibacterium mucosum KCTC 23349]
MSDATPARPVVRAIGPGDLNEALSKGWSDFRRAPLWGLFFGGFYVVAGLIMAVVVWLTGQVYWLAILVFGFPLIGSFAAVGLYEVSHRLSLGQPLDRGILSVIWAQKDRQLPWLCAIIIFIFLFWSFIGHMIFALFLGLTTMVNISTSYEVFLTTNGLAMLGFGSLVGAALAGVIFAITVVGLPLLVDREIDFVTAMLLSIEAARRSPFTMARWAVTIVIMVMIAMVPAFLGLLVVLPILGHATWHLYKRTLQ